MAGFLYHNMYGYSLYYSEPVKKLRHINVISFNKYLQLNQLYGEIN